MAACSDAHECEEEREQGADHDHAEDGQHHGGRGAGADSGGAAACEQPLPTCNQSDRERQKRSLDETGEEGGWP